MQFSKALAVNSAAAAMTAVSFALEGPVATMLLLGGLFALSGALTNQLAIHMLFERVPLMKGSGVIELRFEAFKASIRAMMMEQFFTKAQLDLFFAEEERKIELEPLLAQTDFSPAFDALSQSVMESSFGGMLGMFGGERALEGLREPFTDKLRHSVGAIVRSESFNAQLQAYLSRSSLSDDLMGRIEKTIDARLDELTPTMVKELVHRMIAEHLGWLVVWGGVFGGLIGVISSFLW